MRSDTHHLSKETYNLGWVDDIVIVSGKFWAQSHPSRKVRGQGMALGGKGVMLGRVGKMILGKVR